MEVMMDELMSDEGLDPDFNEEDDDIKGDDLGADDPGGDDIGVDEEDYAYGDSEDPVERVLDVYLSDDLEDQLYLLQYPMRPADRPSNTPSAVKVKAANYLMEVDHAIQQEGKHFDSNAPPHILRATQTHTGSRVRPATNFAFGVIRDNEFHVTPIHATMQMRPCFRRIDEAKAKEIELDLDDPAHQVKDSKPQQVSFKKRESQRATAALKSTYAYKKSVEDAEPWVQLQVHGQNDQPSLDEFGRMFFDDGGEEEGDIEFPNSECYLQGLDYIEEYGENGESISAGSKGRSRDDSIDLASVGSTAHLSAKASSTLLQKVGGDGKVVGYLKLAHLVPFSMLLEVTNMSPETIVGILGARGKRRGLLLRGNWAARAADVWPKGVSHAADCLSVAQVLLHRYGAVSRTDLQRRFPDLVPAKLKEVLSNIAELDTIGRRWVPKVKDGIDFGLEYPDVVEEEEQRWAEHASSLEKRLGKKILERPSCDTLQCFREALSLARGGPKLGILHPRAQTSSAGPGTHALPTNEMGRPRFYPRDLDESKPPATPIESKAEKGMGMKEEMRASAAAAPPAVGGGGAGGGGVSSSTGKPMRKHFKPKRPPTRAAGAMGQVTSIKEDPDAGTEMAHGEGGLEHLDVMAVEEVLEVEEGVIRVKQGANLRSPTAMSIDLDEESGGSVAAIGEDSTSMGSTGGVEGKIPEFAKAKEEPREKTELLPHEKPVKGESMSDIEDEKGGGETKVGKSGASAGDGSMEVAKQEPSPARSVPRPKIRPRPNRAKPKTK